MGTQWGEREDCEGGDGERRKDGGFAGDDQRKSLHPVGFVGA